MKYVSSRNGLGMQKTDRNHMSHNHDIQRKSLKVLFMISLWAAILNICLWRISCKTFQGLHM